MATVGATVRVVTMGVTELTMFTLFTGKGKVIPVKAYYRPIAFQEVEAPRLLECWHMKMVSLSASLPGRFYTSGDMPGSHFC